MARFYMIWLLTLVFPLTMVNGEERKVAPSYCLRFKLNCESEAKKKHVCCTLPLPQGDEVEGSHLDPPGGEEGASGVKIRPIRLPQREKSDGPDNDDSDRNGESKRPSSFNNNNGGLSNPNNRNTPKSSTTTSAPTPSPKRPRICIRLVVNCNSSPEHRCCKADEEEKEVVEDATGEEKVEDEVEVEVEQESPPQDEVPEDQK